MRVHNGKFGWGRLVLAAIVAGSTLSACGARNIYKTARLDSPPIERKYSYLIEDRLMEAGAEPVEFGGPTADRNTVYVASTTKGLQAFHRGIFRLKWTFSVKNGVASTPLLDNGVLYFGANDGNFYALDAEFGRVLWKYETKLPVWTKPTLADKRIYIMAADDVLYCLDAATGKWIWHYKRGGDFITTVRGNSTPAVEGGFVYAGFSDGYVVGLNAKDGNLRWEQRIHKGTKFTDVDAMPRIEGNRIYIPSYDGELYALDRTSGKVLWHIDVGASKRVVLDENRLYVPASDGYIYSVNKDTGRILWKFELDQGTPTQIIEYKNYLAFGSSQQYFYAIHKGDGSLAYRYNVGLRSGFVSTPTLSGDDIFILSNFGNIHVFQWETRPTGAVASN